MSAVIYRHPTAANPPVPRRTGRGRLPKTITFLPAVRRERAISKRLNGAQEQTLEDDCRRIGELAFSIAKMPLRVQEQLFSIARLLAERTPPGAA